MALSEAEINQLIVENFSPKSAPNVLGAFDDRATHSTVAATTREAPQITMAELVQQVADPSNPPKADHLSLQDLRNLAARLAKTETEEELRKALAGVLSGRMMASFFKHLDEARNKAATAERKARDDAFYLALLQAQIAELEFQIGQLEDALDYLHRTGDVNGTTEKPGVQAAIDEWEKRTGRTFDPDDPDAKAILASIIEDDLKDKRLRKAEAERDHNERRSDARAEMEASAERSGEILETRVQRENHLSEPAKVALDDATEKALQAASAIEELEQRLLTLEDLVQHKGSADYENKIDQFLSEASPDTVTKISNDPTMDNALRVRAGVLELKQQISFLNEFKGTPDYSTYLNMAIEDASQEVRNALHNEPDLSEEIIAALYEPFSDSLDGPLEAADTELQPEDRERIANDSSAAPTTQPPGLG